MPKQYVSGRAKFERGGLEALIYDALKLDDALSNNELAAITEYDVTTVNRMTRKLTEMGFLRVAGTGMGRNNQPFKYYALVKEPKGNATKPQSPRKLAKPDGVPNIKRKAGSITDVPFLKWWEGGGLYGKETLRANN